MTGRAEAVGQGGVDSSVGRRDGQSNLTGEHNGGCPGNQGRYGGAPPGNPATLRAQLGRRKAVGERLGPCRPGGLVHNRSLTRLR